MYSGPLPYAAFACATACFAGFFVLDRLVSSGATKQFDMRLILALRKPTGTPPGGGALVAVMRLFTQLGGPVLRYAIAAPAAFALYSDGQMARAVWLVAALGSGWIVDGAFKRLFHRQRPSIVPHLAQAGGPSFPSGHTLNASLVYCGLAIAFSLGAGPVAVVALLSGAVALSFAVAISRVWLGVHWPTDVVAGWLLGTGWWLAGWALGRVLQVV